MSLGRQTQKRRGQETLPRRWRPAAGASSSPHSTPPPPNATINTDNKNTRSFHGLTLRCEASFNTTPGVRVGVEGRGVGWRNPGKQINGENKSIVWCFQLSTAETPGKKKTDKRRRLKENEREAKRGRGGGEKNDHGNIFYLKVSLHLL